MSEESHTNYVKIWALLVVLLAVSVLGPMLEIQIITLLTAFGIAFVKAYLVAKYFMHINMTPRFVPYLMVTCLVFMLLFVVGTAPDVYKSEGTNWKKTAEWQYMPPSPADHGGAAEHH
ncbi:MAG: cytochrome C oxidase subunit IV family protein [Myxococcota bacterium]|jgi:caa(3)-type oxidase subunit IV|nr:cytochrome C oxidase subunit IV family protein [Myxococcota bacterium]